MRSLPRGGIVSLKLFIFFLVGCSSHEDPLEDLREVTGRLSPPKGSDQVELAPLPEPAQALAVQFDDLDRSPFERLTAPTPKEKTGPMYTGPRPDPDRPRDPLEQYNLGDLELVGTMKESTGEWRAFIKAPDGIIYRLREGDYMGQHNGRIERIEAEGMALREIVPRSEGRWKIRRRTVALTPQES